MSFMKDSSFTLPSYFISPFKDEKVDPEIVRSIGNSLIDEFIDQLLHKKEESIKQRVNQLAVYLLERSGIERQGLKERLDDLRVALLIKLGLRKEPKPQSLASKISERAAPFLNQQMANIAKVSLKVGLEILIKKSYC